LFIPRYRYEFHQEVITPKSNEVDLESEVSKTNEQTEAKHSTNPETKTETIPKFVIKKEQHDTADNFTEESRPNLHGYCPSCGMENIAEANFCHACGEKLR
jgi:hypothetical protein